MKALAPVIIFIVILVIIFGAPYLLAILFPLLCAGLFIFGAVKSGRRPDAMTEKIESLLAQARSNSDQRGWQQGPYSPNQGAAPVRRPPMPEDMPQQDRPRFLPTNETYDEFSADFQREYYRAHDKGRDFDPWDLPPEKSPWER